MTTGEAQLLRKQTVPARFDRSAVVVVGAAGDQYPTEFAWEVDFEVIDNAFTLGSRGSFHDEEITFEIWSGQPPDDSMDWERTSTTEIRLLGEAVSLLELEDTEHSEPVRLIAGVEDYVLRVSYRGHEQILAAIVRVYATDGRVSNQLPPNQEDFRVELWPRS